MFTIIFDDDLSCVPSTYIITLISFFSFCIYYLWANLNSLKFKNNNEVTMAATASYSSSSKRGYKFHRMENKT